MLDETMTQGTRPGIEQSHKTTVKTVQTYTRVYKGISSRIAVAEIMSRDRLDEIRAFLRDDTRTTKRRLWSIYCGVFLRGCFPRDLRDCVGSPSPLWSFLIWRFTFALLV